MRSSVSVCIIVYAIASVALPGYAVTRHFSFQPREAVVGGGASVILPVPKKIADAYDRGRQQQKEKRLSIIGKVTMVADGDTITVTPTGGSKSIVRLSGVAAPKGTESGAAEALNSLSGLIKDKKVTVRYLAKDKSGMVPGVVWLGKVNVNKSMVVSGLVKATDKEYEDDQRQAKMAKRGIWAEAK